MKIDFKKDKIPFTQVANAVLNDPNLSAKAKGVYAYLYSKPEGWDFSAERIAKDFSDGRKAIMAGLQELEEGGHLTRERQGNGRVSYHIHSPETALGVTDPKSPNGTVPKRHSAQKGLISNKELKVIKNKTNNKENVPLSKKRKFSDSDLLLAELLLSKIILNYPEFENKKVKIEEWAEDIRKLREIDKATESQIAFMIHWVQGGQWTPEGKAPQTFEPHEFWSANIMSAHKLRKQWFDNLVPQLQEAFKKTVKKNAVAQL